MSRCTTLSSMNGEQDLEDLRGHAEGPRQRQRAAGEQGGELLARHQLGDEVVDPSVDPDVEQARQPGVLELGHQADLALKALDVAAAGARGARAGGGRLEDLPHLAPGDLVQRLEDPAAAPRPISLRSR